MPSLLEQAGIEVVEVRPSSSTPNFEVPFLTPTGQDSREALPEFLRAPRNDFRDEARILRSEARVLPRALRRPLKRLRTVMLQQKYMDLLREESVRRASVRGAYLETTGGLTEAGVGYIPRIEADEIYREICADGQFMGQVRKALRQLKREFSMKAFWNDEPGRNLRRKVELTAFEPNVVRGAWGLVVKSLPHAPPEDALLVIARKFWQRHGKNTSKKKVLNWGAGNSPLSWALLGTNRSVLEREVQRDSALEDKAPNRIVEIDEVEVIGTLCQAPGVTSRSKTVPQGRNYDLVSIALPPPTHGKGGYRLQHAEEKYHPGKDLGRMSPQKWLQSLSKVLKRPLAAGSDIVTILVPRFELGRLDIPESASDARVTVVREVLQRAGYVGLVEYPLVAEECAQEPWTLIEARRPL